jgi:hypothetical protein
MAPPAPSLGSSEGERSQVIPFFRGAGRTAERVVENWQWSKSLGGDRLSSETHDAAPKSTERHPSLGTFGPVAANAMAHDR